LNSIEKSIQKQLVIKKMRVRIMDSNKIRINKNKKKMMILSTSQTTKEIKLKTNRKVKPIIHQNLLMINNRMTNLSL